MKDTYRVVVTREGDSWLADVPQLEGAHTFAGTLSKLDRFVRDVIVLAEDLPDEAASAVRLDYVYHTGDASLDEALSSAGQDRRHADEVLAHAWASLRNAIVHGSRFGLSVRDLATATGVSYQRVSQVAKEVLAGASPRRPAKPARATAVTPTAAARRKAVTTRATGNPKRAAKTDLAAAARAGKSSASRSAASAPAAIGGNRRSRPT